MKGYTVYNVVTGMVVYVTEPIQDDDFAAREAMELAHGCAMTNSCVLVPAIP